MRLYGISRVSVEAIARRPLKVESDERGNQRLSGLLDDGGHAIIVVLAGDDPSFVITTFPDD
jgi:hypothetical protein